MLKFLSKDFMPTEVVKFVQSKSPARFDSEILATEARIYLPDFNSNSLETRVKTPAFFALHTTWFSKIKTPLFY